MIKITFYFFLIFTGILITNFEPVTSQEWEYAGRKWFEWNNTLYRLAVEPESKWKEAHVQCKKEKLQLIRNDSIVPELKDFIKSTFDQFPSFWMENNVTEMSFMQKIGFKKSKKGQKCNKIHRKTFTLQTEECDKELGFICETKLDKSPSQFMTKNRTFYIQPEKEFYCGETRDLCMKRNMTLVTFNSYDSLVSLKDFIFLRYGSKPIFWLAVNATSTECVLSKKTKDKGKHGFVCEAPYEQPKFTFRHIILITFVSVIAFLSIILFIIVKFCLFRKSEDIKNDIQHEKK